MSRENVEVVRYLIAVRAHPRRHLEERLGLRFPRVLALVALAVWRLPPRSRLRQAVIRRTVRVAVEALNRGDYEANSLAFHPDVEVIMPPSLVTLGWDPVYRGLEERIALLRRWDSEWGGFQFEPQEVITLGDRVLILGQMRGSGITSGAGFEGDWASLFTLSAGRTIRDQILLDRGEALEAVGLSE